MANPQLAQLQQHLSGTSIPSFYGHPLSYVFGDISQHPNPACVQYLITRTNALLSGRSDKARLSGVTLLTKLCYDKEHLPIATQIPVATLSQWVASTMTLFSNFKNDNVAAMALHGIQALFSIAHDHPDATAVKEIVTSNMARVCNAIFALVSQHPDFASVGLMAIGDLAEGYPSSVKPFLDRLAAGVMKPLEESGAKRLHVSMLQILPSVFGSVVNAASHSGPEGWSKMMASLLNTVNMTLYDVKKAFRPNIPDETFGPVLLQIRLDANDLNSCCRVAQNRLEFFRMCFESALYAETYCAIELPVRELIQMIRNFTIVCNELAREGELAEQHVNLFANTTANLARELDKMLMTMIHVSKRRSLPYHPAIVETVLDRLDAHNSKAQRMSGYEILSKVVNTFGSGPIGNHAPDIAQACLRDAKLLRFTPQDNSAKMDRGIQEVGAMALCSINHLLRHASNALKPSDRVEIDRYLLKALVTALDKPPTSSQEAQNLAVVVDCVTASIGAPLHPQYRHATEMLSSTNQALQKISFATPFESIKRACDRALEVYDLVVHPHAPPIQRKMVQLEAISKLEEDMEAREREEDNWKKGIFESRLPGPMYQIAVEPNQDIETEAPSRPEHSELASADTIEQEFQRHATEHRQAAKRVRTESRIEDEPVLPVNKKMITEPPQPRASVPKPASKPLDAAITSEDDEEIPTIDMASSSEED